MTKASHRLYKVDVRAQYPTSKDKCDIVLICWIPWNQGRAKKYTKVNYGTSCGRAWSMIQVTKGLFGSGVLEGRGGFIPTS